MDYGKAGDDFLGMFRVPLKDIPATGHDKWFDLYEDKKSKIKVQGQCRLRLELAFKVNMVIFEDIKLRSVFNIYIFLKKIRLKQNIIFCYSSSMEGLISWIVRRAISALSTISTQ